MAVDHGILSWTDVEYRPDTARDSHWPVTLVTWPPGAGTRAGDREPLYRILSSTHVRILVFSKLKVMRVSVSIDDGDSVECDTNTGHLYTAPWTPGQYASGAHVMLVTVEDEFGETHVTRHVFSLDGSTGQHEWSLPSLGQIILSVDMIALFQVDKVCCLFVFISLTIDTILILTTKHFHFFESLETLIIYIISIQTLISPRP